jgi:hypothetical protein
MDHNYLKLLLSCHTNVKENTIVLNTCYAGLVENNKCAVIRGFGFAIELKDWVDENTYVDEYRVYMNPTGIPHRVTIYPQVPILFVPFNSADNVNQANKDLVIISYGSEKGDSKKPPVSNYHKGIYSYFR